MPVNPDILLKHFTPDKFLIKITPVNPTYKALQNNLKSYITPDISIYEKIELLKQAGYEVIISIGELEENNIGSNCGQYLTNFENSQLSLKTTTHTSLKEFKNF